MAYASGGYYLDGKTPADLGREMAGYVALGFKAVKMKTGRLSPAEEETRVAAARAAIGPDMLLMLDVNNGWADLPRALMPGTSAYAASWHTTTDQFGPHLQGSGWLGRVSSQPDWRHRSFRLHLLSGQIPWIHGLRGQGQKRVEGQQLAHACHLSLSKSGQSVRGNPMRPRRTES